MRDRPGNLLPGCYKRTTFGIEQEIAVSGPVRKEETPEAPSLWWRRGCVECHHQTFMPRNTEVCMYCRGPEKPGVARARRSAMGYVSLQRLRECRRQRGMTQETLAKLSGISAFTIASHESGRHQARFSTARLLATALGTTVEELQRIQSRRAGSPRERRKE